MLVSFFNLIGTELELLGKRKAQLSNCYSQNALKVNLCRGVGRGHFLNYLLMWRAKPIVGGTTFVQMGLGAARKQTELATGSKTVSSTPPCLLPLFQLELLP